MKKLIIIRGNSGSGKTTTAKLLQRQCGSNTMLISQDVVRREMLMVKDGEHTLALPLMKELLCYGYKHSDIVILEGILIAEWYQTLFELACQLYQQQIYAYYFDLPFEETVLRHATRHKEFSVADMQRWWKEKDFVPMLQETCLTKDDNLEDIVAMIYSAVKKE